MNEFSRPLSGCVLNLSVSENEDSPRMGFPDWQVNRVTLQITSALFGQGVSILFGHDWREDGVMRAIYGFAQQVQPPLPVSSADTNLEYQPLLVNCITWPDAPSMSLEDLEALQPTLSVEQLGVPEELDRMREDALREGSSSRLYKYIRARSLTGLRNHLTTRAEARLCLGGRRTRFEGRYPGVLEEALLALLSSKPLYLSGLIGGMALDLIKVIESQQSLDFLKDLLDREDLFGHPPVKENNSATLADRQIDLRAIVELFQQVGRTKILLRNGLSEDENRELFHTEVIERVIQLVLLGLARLRAAR